MKTKIILCFYYCYYCYLLLLIFIFIIFLFIFINLFVANSSLDPTIEDSYRKQIVVKGLPRSSAAAAAAGKKKAAASSSFLGKIFGGKRVLYFRLFIGLNRNAFQPPHQHRNTPFLFLFLEFLSFLPLFFFSLVESSYHIIFFASHLKHMQDDDKGKSAAPAGGIEREHSGSTPAATEKPMRVRARDTNVCALHVGYLPPTAAAVSFATVCIFWGLLKRLCVYQCVQIFFSV